MAREALCIAPRTRRPRPSWRNRRSPILHRNCPALISPSCRDGALPEDHQPNHGMPRYWPRCHTSGLIRSDASALGPHDPGRREGFGLVLQEALATLHTWARPSGRVKRARSPISTSWISLEYAGSAGVWTAFRAARSPVAGPGSRSGPALWLPRTGRYRRRRTGPREDVAVPRNRPEFLDGALNIMLTRWRIGPVLSRPQVKRDPSQRGLSTHRRTGRRSRCANQDLPPPGRGSPRTGRTPHPRADRPETADYRLAGHCDVLGVDGLGVSMATSAASWNRWVTIMSKPRR